MKSTEQGRTNMEVVNVTRYVNGVKVEPHDFAKIRGVTSPVIESAIETARRRREGAGAADGVAS